MWFPIIQRTNIENKRNNKKNCSMWNFHSLWLESYTSSCRCYATQRDAIEEIDHLSHTKFRKTRNEQIARSVNWAHHACFNKGTTTKITARYRNCVIFRCYETSVSRCVQFYKGGRRLDACLCEVLRAVWGVARAARRGLLRTSRLPPPSTKSSSRYKLRLCLKPGLDSLDSLSVMYSSESKSISSSESGAAWNHLKWRPSHCVIQQNWF